jgi:hypothetical protein
MVNYDMLFRDATLDRSKNDETVLTKENLISELGKLSN